MVSRLMLNLRGVYLAASELPPGSSDETVQVSWSIPFPGLRFSSTVSVGNLGAPLTHRVMSSVTNLVGLENLGGAGGKEEGPDEWSVEDEVLESSRDPLAAGLGCAGDT